jgi:hypothetical protein
MLVVYHIREVVQFRSIESLVDLNEFVLNSGELIGLFGVQHYELVR